MKIKTIFLLIIMNCFLISILYINIQESEKEIQGFYNSWDGYEYTNIRYDLLNTIVYSHVYIDANGSVVYINNDNPSNLISYAHDKKVKVVLMFKAKDELSKDSILGNQTIRMITINNLLAEVIKYDFDGIDIDLEGLNVTNSKNGQPNKQLMTEFVTNLSNEFRKVNSVYRISINIGFDYRDMDNIFDVSKIQSKVNYIMIMGYDQYGPWSSFSGPNAPIRLDNGIGIYDSINHYKRLIDKKKLLIGVPWYGYEFATVDNTRLSPINGNVNYISYKDYIKVVGNFSRKWDSVWQTPWYARKEDSQWYQFHYEDVDSLAIKYDLVKVEGLGGIGIWTINFGSDRTELWQLIRDKFKSKAPASIYPLLVIIR